jgi:hypothetical protein
VLGDARAHVIERDRAALVVDDHVHHTLERGLARGIILDALPAPPRIEADTRSAASVGLMLVPALVTINDLSLRPTTLISS